MTEGAAATATINDFKTGKGCINVRDKDEIPVEDIAAVGKHAVQNPEPPS